MADQSATSQIGKNMQAARENAGLEQESAARLLAVHPQTLSKYERGVIKKVPLAVLEAAARAYGETIERLTKDEIRKGESLSEKVERGTSASLSRKATVSGPASSRALARSRRAEQFEREMVRLGANDYEADWVRSRARTYLESVLSSGGTEDPADEDALDREFDIYLQNTCRLWVLDQMRRRGAEPNDGQLSTKRPSRR